MHSPHLPCYLLEKVLDSAQLSIFFFFLPQKREGILQSRQIQEEITGNTE